MKFRNYTRLLFFLIILFALSEHSIGQTTDKAKLLQFEEAITRGEEFLQAKDYAKAKAEYQKALSIDPQAKYPKDKLAQIRKFYIDPKDETDFNAAIALGDQLFAAGNYTAAKEKYSAALTIKPEDRITREKVTNTTKLANEKIVLSQEYASLIQSADKLLLNKEYNAAIEKYLLANQLNTGETYPTVKIKEIENILARQKELDESYNLILTEADEAYMNRNFPLAKAKYEQASKLKPTEGYPKNMLERVNESSETQALNAAQQEKLLNENYNSAIASGDQLIKENRLNESLQSFELASSLKPNEVYPKQKIDQIKKLLAEQEEALKAEIAAKELVEKQKEDARLAEIAAAELAEKQKEEARLSALALQEKAEQNRQDSIKAAQDALALSAQQAEEARLAKIAADELAEKQKEEARLAALALQEKAEQNRQDSIKAAQDALALSAQQAEEARLAKIAADELAEKQMEEARLSALALQEKAEQNRQDSIKAAQDALVLSAQQAEEARLAKIAADELAEKQMEEARMAEIAATELAEKQKEEARLAEIARLEEEKAKLLELEQRSQIDLEYFDAIDRGNQLYTQQDFTSAQKFYEKAAELKPMEDLPKDRLILINNILIERLKNNLEVYNKFITAGDLAYQSNIFDKAIEEFEKANATRPEETYPTLMIGKIRKLMEDNAITDLITDLVVLPDTTEQKYRFNTIEMRLRKNNYIVIKARKTSEKPPKVFINFGKDSQKSGGIVLKTIESDEPVDYLLRISAQDMWYRKDNNWITLYSEGGNLEISSMQISQGDIQGIKE